MDHPATSDRKGLAVRPHNVAFTVVDLKRARAWYAAALGFELARGNPRAAPHPERGGKPRIGIHLAQLLADPHRQIPLRERRPRHSRGELGNIRPGPRLHRHDDTILRPGEEEAEKNADRTEIISHGRLHCPANPAACRRISPAGSYRRLTTAFTVAVSAREPPGSSLPANAIGVPAVGCCSPLSRSIFVVVPRRSSRGPR